mmetsp:Transcript_14131/g.34193  ORF Transcript_14131/g.34193 Transcript_14131/m.34193 type:complete len:303 (-) Transcript_14131:241-1149(-)
MGVMGGAMGLGGAAAAPPGVNASPYGGNLAIPPPSVSPSAGPPPQKKSLLGSASPAGAHVAFPVRSLTPRSPWLTSRGGLTPRMKPRGKSASPSPGGGDYSGASPASGGGDVSGGGGGTPSQMAAAGNWMFKPRDNPRSLFIRPEPAAPSPLASLVAMSPARGSPFTDGGSLDANGRSGGGGGGGGGRFGLPRHNAGCRGLLVDILGFLLSCFDGDVGSSLSFCLTPRCGGSSSGGGGSGAGSSGGISRLFHHGGLLLRGSLLRVISVGQFLNRGHNRSSSRRVVHGQKRHRGRAVFLFLVQ